MHHIIVHKTLHDSGTGLSCDQVGVQYCESYLQNLLDTLWNYTFLGSKLLNVLHLRRVLIPTSFYYPVPAQSWPWVETHPSTRGRLPVSSHASPLETDPASYSTHEQKGLVVHKPTTFGRFRKLVYHLISGSPSTLTICVIAVTLVVAVAHRSAVARSAAESGVKVSIPAIRVGCEFAFWSDLS